MGTLSLRFCLNGKPVFGWYMLLTKIEEKLFQDIVFDYFLIYALQLPDVSHVICPGDLLHHLYRRFMINCCV